MFRQAVRSFIEKEVEPHIEEWEQAGQIPKSIWPRMGELGFLGVEYDEKYGGGGADFQTTMVLCEEMARSRSGSLAMAVGVQTDMASPHLYWTGSEALKETYLPGICAGRSLCCIAVTEPGGGSDVAAIKTRAVRDGDHYVLNGSKMFITNGAMADIYFVAARIEQGDKGEGDSQGKRHRGISMFLVERSTPGLTVSRKLDKMGMRASDTAELSFQDMRVPAGNLLGREGVGFYEVMRVFQRERLVAGLHAIAGCQRALEDTIAYVQQRQAFDSPLSKKQVVRHKLADLAIEAEIGRLFAYRVAWMQRKGLSPGHLTSVSRLFGAELQQHVAQVGMEVLGLYGQLGLGSYRSMLGGRIALEYLASVAATISAGTAEMQRNIIATRGLGMTDVK